MVSYKAVWFKEMYKYTKKSCWGEGVASRIWEGEDTSGVTCLISENWQPDRGENIFSIDRFIPIASNSVSQLPQLNADAYVSLPNYSVNGLLFQLSEKGIWNGRLLFW